MVTNWKEVLLIFPKCLKFFCCRTLGRRRRPFDIDGDGMKSVFSGVILWVPREWAASPDGARWAAVVVVDTRTGPWRAFDGLSSCSRAILP